MSISEGESENVVLLGGHVDDDGLVHDDVELSPLTGYEEYELGNVRAGTCAATISTWVLSQCVKRVGAIRCVDESLIRSLLVGDRDYLIIKLRSLSFGSRVDCVFRCTDSQCGALMDVTFNLDEIEFECKPITQRYFEVQIPTAAEPGSDYKKLIQLRLPNGGDQETLATWMDDEAVAVEELLKRCARGSDDLEVRSSEIDKWMHRLAPHAELDIEAECPECGRAFNHNVDVAKLFLDDLAAGLSNLERDVHVLAWHYHWSEAEILSMPRPKRRRYVMFVEKEIDRLNQVW